MARSHHSPDMSESVYGLGITPGLGYITGPEGQRAEAEALRKDRACARRVVVSLVGRERQGKTSLRRLLAGEPFNKDEPSTVGLERDLVDTQALDPGSGPGADWRSVNVDKTNLEEYHEVLGRRIHQRLEQRRHRIPAIRRFLNAFLTMSKIGVISYVSMFFFFFASSFTASTVAPVWGASIIVMFLLCGAAFGKRDGFGIAVGIYHLMVLCESFIRWRMRESFEELVSAWGVAFAYLLGFLQYGMMESVVATCFGMSLGLGMACLFCLSSPGPTDYFQDGNPLTSPELHLMVVSCLFGLGFVQNRLSRLFIPVVMILLFLLMPPFSFFVFLCGTTCGTCHGPFLALGRSLFLTLNCAIKQVTTRPLGRHMVRHCLGLVPGFVVSRYMFGWRIVTCPLQAVVAHVISAVLLIAVNEIDVSIKILPCLSVSVSSVSPGTASESKASSTSSGTTSSGTTSCGTTSSGITSSAELLTSSNTLLSSSSSSSLQASSTPIGTTSSSNTSADKSDPLPASSLSTKTSHHQKYMDQLLARPRSGSGSLTTEQPTRVLASSTSSIPSPPRLVVRDFAGHPLYYSAHHVYMAAHCVYVLVFSLVEARHNFPQVLHNVVDWLQSIFLHTGFPDTRVFLVGTHRDDPVLRGKERMDVEGESFVGRVGQRLRKEIPRSFHNLLVWTDQDVPLFPVENSLRDHKDPDHKYLRQQLLKVVSEVNTDKFPVRYFYFFHILDDLRSSGRLLADTDRLRRQCQNSPCAIRDQEDMDAMLLLFRRLGEVLYFPEDNLLQSVVVLSPHVVLSVLSRLLDVPKRADRERGLVNEWDRLASTGVCSRGLFEHVLRKHVRELRPQSDTVVYLLQTLNLMCPLNINGGEGWGAGGSGDDAGGGGGYGITGLRFRGGGGGGSGSGGQGNGGRGRERSGNGGGGDDDDDDDDGEDDESDEDNSEGPHHHHQHRGQAAEEQEDEIYNPGELYLVPAALPQDLPDNQSLWDTSSQDWQLLIDGLPLLPHSAFLRLLSVCATQDACQGRDDLGWPVLCACQSRASFTFGCARCYKLEWAQTSTDVADAYHGRLLKVVIAGWRGGSVGLSGEENRFSSVDYLGGVGRNIRGGGGGIGGGDSSGRAHHDGGGGGGGGSAASPQSVLEFVWRSLVEIVRRDFGRCHLRLGVACPCPAPHQIPCDETGFHFLSLTDTREGPGSLQVPETKEFWCQGRHVVYTRGKVRESSPQRVATPSGMTPPPPPPPPPSATITTTTFTRTQQGGRRPPDVLDLPLRSMPHSLHARVCDLLDVPHALGNDWTAVAGHLDKTVQEVDLLKLRAPRDPCDALLQDWATRDPAATVRDLLHLMYTMQRLDVVKTIQDFGL